MSMHQYIFLSLATILHYASHGQPNKYITSLSYSLNNTDVALGYHIPLSVLELMPAMFAITKCVFL